MDWKNGRQSANVEDRRNDPPVDPEPKWLGFLIAKQAAAKHGIPYETGDANFDEFLRASAFGQQQGRRPRHPAYDSPDDARYSLREAYMLGKSGNYSGFEDLLGSERDTPFGHVAWRAFNDGLDSMGSVMNARRRGGMRRLGGFGFSEGDGDGRTQ